MADYCAICWKHLGLVGPKHHCVPRAKPDHVIAAEAKAERPAVETKPEVVSDRTPIVGQIAAANTDDDRPAANAAANTDNDDRPAANTPASYARWRIRDVDKRRTYMRTYMATRRQAKAESVMRLTQ